MATGLSLTLIKTGLLVWGSFHIGGWERERKSKMPGGAYIARGWGRDLLECLVG